MRNFAVPDSAFAQHTIALGKTRSGKSSKLRVIVEQLLERKMPVTIIDPKGDWWGLKSSADGKSAGFPVVIFGGEHADVPITEHSGAAVAELIATGNRPCIIDLGGWMVGERTRFFIQFASALFRTTRGSRWLVIDECHNFAPQGRIHDPDAGRMLHWANRLASEGAGKGLTLISASQRPQKVSKDYVTSHETLIACRVIHPLDRGAIKDWIDGCADPAMGKEVIGALATMDRSQAYVWSPEIGFGPALVDWPLFRTYDSFKPQAASQKALKGWAAVDLEDVREKMAGAIEEAKANDPKVLRAEIVKLKAAIGKLSASNAVEKSNTPDPDIIDAAEKAAFAAGVASGTADAYQKGVGDGIGMASAALLKAVKDLGSVPVTVPTPRQLTYKSPARSPKTVIQPATAFSKGMTISAPGTPVDGGVITSVSDGGLSGPQRKLLGALAWWRAMGHPEPSRPQVAAIAGWRINAGHLKNVIGSLNARGLICYPQPCLVSLTATGRDVAPEPDLSRTLHDSIRGILNGPQRQIFECLVRAGGPLSRPAIATACGWQPDAGHLKNVVGSLRTLEVISYPNAGVIELQPWVQ